MSSRLRSSTRASTIASLSTSNLLPSEKPLKVAKNSEHKMQSTKRTVSTRSVRTTAEMQRLYKIAGLAMFAASAFLAVGFQLVNNGTIVLYPKHVDVAKLSGFAARAEYALRYQVLLLFWLSFNIHAVIYARLTRKAVNPLLDTTEKNVQGIKNVLTNSLEHIFLSVFAQLTFVSFADHSLILKFIPFVNIVQFLGRIFFLLGYPYYRTFGFVLTSVPNSALIVYNLYKFGSFINIY